jgi:hypothetical protein
VFGRASPASRGETLRTGRGSRRSAATRPSDSASASSAPSSTWPTEAWKNARSARKTAYFFAAHHLQDDPASQPVTSRGYTGRRLALRRRVTHGRAPHPRGGGGARGLWRGPSRPGREAAQPRRRAWWSPKMVRSKRELVPDPKSRESASEKSALPFARSWPGALHPYVCSSGSHCPLNPDAAWPRKDTTPSRSCS